MPVHIQNREGGEVLGSSVLLAAFDDGFERYMRTLMRMRARGEEPDAELQREHDQYPV